MKKAILSILFVLFFAPCAFFSCIGLGSAVAMVCPGRSCLDFELATSSGSAAPSGLPQFAVFYYDEHLPFCAEGEENEENEESESHGRRLGGLPLFFFQYPVARKACGWPACLRVCGMSEADCLAQRPILRL